MQELVRGIKINILGNLFRFSRFGFFVVAALLYGTELFGIYTVTWATSEVLLRFGLLGLDHGLLCETSHFHETDETRKLYQKISSSLKVCLLVSCLGTAALLVHTYLFVDVRLTRISLFILAPTLPFYNVGVLLIQATMGMKEMKYNAIIRSGIEPFTMMVLLFVFWITPMKDYGIILAQATALMLVFVLSIFSFRRFFSWREVFRTWKRPGRYRAIIQYSIPMYVIELVDTTLYRLDIFIISAFLGTGSPAQMKLLGVYGFAKQVARVVNQTKTAFGQIFVPVSSESYLKQADDELWDQVRFAMEKLILLNIALGLFLAIFNQELVAIVGKDSSILAPAAYFWLLAGQFSFSSLSLLMYFLVTTQKSRTYLIMMLLTLGASALLGSALVQTYQVVGAAAAVGIGYLAIGLFTITETIRFHRHDFLSRRTLRVILSGLITAAVVSAIKSFIPSTWPTLAIMVASFLPGLCCYFVITTSREQWKGLLKL